MLKHIFLQPSMGAGFILVLFLVYVIPNICFVAFNSLYKSFCSGLISKDQHTFRLFLIS